MFLFFLFFLQAFTYFATPYFFLPKSSEIQEGIKKLPSDQFEIIATGLEIPWDLVFLPDGDILISERPGRLIQKGKKNQIIPIETAFDPENEEGGLLGIVLHPDFVKNHKLYLYTSKKKKGGIVNQVEQYHFENGQLSDKKIILDNIPYAKYHDGGRIAFGPDGDLYITTGDAEKSELAQDIHSLAGKILRLKEDGSIPPDNPFGNAVYSYGHRNSQGLAWDSSKRLWSIEHGPSGWGKSGYDELNFIEKGKNYGWPIIQGNEKKEGMVTPLLQSGKDVWAPASASFWDGSIFFGGLRGEALYEADITKDPIALKEHFKKQFGRIRTVVLGPDGFFYITTSNRDGRGFPKKGDDQIIKIDPDIFRKTNFENP